jgi:hypothetical protein
VQVASLYGGKAVRETAGDLRDQIDTLLSKRALAAVSVPREEITIPDPADPDSTVSLWVVAARTAP